MVPALTYRRQNKGGRNTIKRYVLESSSGILEAAEMFLGAEILKIETDLRAQRLKTY